MRIERRKFIKSKILGFSAVSLVGYDIFAPSEKADYVELPTIDGKIDLLLASPTLSVIGVAHAQGLPYYGLPPGYGGLAPMDYIAIVEAQIRMERQLAEWQRQERYRWMHQEYMERMRRAMANQRDYSEVGSPNVWESIESTYSLGRRRNGQLGLMGLSRQQEPVSVTKTLQGSAAVWNVVNKAYSSEEAEKTVGPQSNEQRAKMTLPNGQTLLGNAYATENGTLSFSDDVHVTRDGRRGRVVKYETGPDGERYMLV